MEERVYFGLSFQKNIVQLGGEEMAWQSRQEVGEHGSIHTGSRELNRK